MLPTLCILTAHPNPANHFATFVEHLKTEVPCKIYADKGVAEKFSKSQVSVRVIDIESDDFISQMEGELASEAIIITDIAKPQWIALHQMLKSKYPSIERAVYYDNPERHVPGGYSELAESIISEVGTVLFANKSHVEQGVEKDEGVPIDLSGKRKIGVGYYPKSDAEKILALRKDSESVKKIKASLFAKHNIPVRDQKVVVYTGGANETYYKEAFPHFVELVKELAQKEESSLSNTVFVLQQHPRAKREGNVDAKAVEELTEQSELPKDFHFIVSDISTPECLAIANATLYYQTSMAAQFVFAGIPTVAQTGHNTYSDLVVRAGFPSVTKAEQLAEILTEKATHASIENLEKELGASPEWKENLIHFVQG